MGNELKAKGSNAKLGFKEYILAIFFSAVAAALVATYDYENISSGWYWIKVVSMLVFSMAATLAISIYSLRNGVLDNWGTWSKIYGHPRLLAMSSAAITIATIYSATPDFASSELPLKFYLWWIALFLAFSGVIVFSALAPPVFKYKNFSTYENEHKNYWPIRDDLIIAIEEVAKDCSDQALAPELKKKARMERRELARIEREGLSANGFYIIRQRVKETKKPPAFLLIMFTGIVMILGTFMLSNFVKVGAGAICKLEQEQSTKSSTFNEFCTNR